jgi:hypothetical protein
MRKDTMADVCKVTEELCEKAISILERVEAAQGFKVPVFKLGPDEEPIVLAADVTLEWANGSKVTYQSEDEIRAQYVWKGPEESALSEHMEGLLRAAGKTRANLTQDSYGVLVNSEILRSQSSRAGTGLGGSPSVATQ